MFCEECARAGGDRQRREDALGIARRPLQHLHAAERAAGDREQRLDAELVEQHRLGAHHVAHGDHRQVEAVDAVGRRVGRGRAGGAHAAADDVGADDEIAVGVDGAAGTDHQAPPAGLAGHRVDAGDVLVAGQCVADEDGVGALAVELAIGLVGDLQVGEVAAGIERERLVVAEAGDKARRVVGLVAGVGRPGAHRRRRGIGVLGGRRDFGEHWETSSHSSAMPSKKQSRRGYPPAF